MQVVSITEARKNFKEIFDSAYLKYEFSGFWSRRITDEHRLVYAVDASSISIASCRYHY